MNDPQHRPGESPLETLLLDTAGRPRRTRRWLPQLLLSLSLVLLVLGGWWSREPPAPELPAAGDAAVVPGATATTMLVATLRALLDKPGGLLANDVLPPGAWLDDVPSFEAGALDASRTFLAALLHDFSRRQAVEDPDLLRAEPRLQFDIHNWRVPAAEDEYADAIVAIEAYQARLRATPPAALFELRGDTLARWLDAVIAGLDARDRLLAAAPSLPATQVDDHFFSARGYCWALQVQLRALRREYALLTPKHDAAFAAAVQALDGTLLPVKSPVVLNGGEYGMLANHSLVLAGHVGRSVAALRELRAGMTAY